MCMAWLKSLFGGGKHILDGPNMERPVCREFTMSRCDVRFEVIYSYTVRLEDDLLCVKTHDGKPVEKSITLRSDDVNTLYKLDLLALPDEDALCGKVLGLTVTDTYRKTSKKSISPVKEAEILAVLAPYIDSIGSEEEPFMLDGPSMEYQAPWASFAVSRSASSNIYSFWFDVDGDEATVIGECRDSEGHTYESAGAVPISEETIDRLRELDLEKLPNEEPWLDDLEIPQDGDSRGLTLTLEDGEVVKKNLSSELMTKIYDLLLPYLKNN